MGTIPKPPSAGPQARLVALIDAARAAALSGRQDACQNSLVLAFKAAVECPCEPRPRAV